MHTPTHTSTQGHLPFARRRDDQRFIPPTTKFGHEEQSKELYFALSSRYLTQQALDQAQGYLQQQLQTAAALPADIPADMAQLPEWIRDNTHQVGVQYEEYLRQRKTGMPRRYFSSKSHALHFLQSIAPTKLVDGSWLYGLVQQWRDPRFAALIRIYLEELGEGLPQKNHVVLYKKLLATHGCEQWQSLSDEHFVQGAIQLALAHQAEQFLPEVIGFNLGYEQLPLHLLITAFELNELDIDPYYFTLHITVDNASTGHAHKAVQGLLELLPQLGGGADFYRRMINGYKLNMLGASSTAIISAFDLDEEIVQVLRAKSVVGKRMHSDFCRIGGRTVNEWLGDPAQIPQFLLSLQQNGWIKRHQDPQQGRFWRLLEGDKAEMFGVFSAYEKQVIYDWILDEADAGETGPRPLTFRARQRLMRTLEPLADDVSSEPADDGEDNEFNADLQALEAQLALLRSKDETMAVLTGLMSPTRHHTPPGLMATRIFTWMLDEKAYLM